MSTKVSTDLIDLSSNTGGLVWAKGTTLQQPASATAGEMRVDTTTATTLVYNGTQWKTLKETAFVAPPVPTHFLVVAGGGAGGRSGNNTGSGAGGAGGLRTSYGSTSGGNSSAESNIEISLNTPYNITVGNGGAGTTTATNGNQGTSSTFSTITSIGGGGGFIQGSAPASTVNGGSGGGGEGFTTSAGGVANPGNGFGTGETDQGKDGGVGSTSVSAYGGGGGGGAITVGGGGSGTSGGSGGTGLESSITGTATFFAGGGGGGSSTATGGTGGSGIGGNGGSSVTGSDAGDNGVFNTGSGGGGGGNMVGGAGGSGGSGVVILRYPTADLPYFTTTGTLNTPSATDTVADVAYPVTNTAYYKLDSNANDSALSGYIGQGAMFNGTNSIISLPSNLISGTTDSDYSVSMWVKFNTLPTSNFISLIGPNLSVFRLLLYYNSGSTYNVNLLRTFGGSYYYTSASTGIQATLSTGQYYNIIVTYQSSNKLVNGYLNGSSIGSYTLNLSASGTAGAPILGSYNGSTLYNLNGSLDQIRIYNTTLSTSNVALLYAETSATSSTLNYPTGTGGQALYEFSGNADSTSSSAYNGTATDVLYAYNGTASNVTYGNGRFNEAANFNGTSSVISLGTSSPLNTFGGAQTISVWVKPSSASQEAIIGYRDDNSPYWWNLIEKMSNNTIRFLLGTTPGNVQFVFNSVGTITLNQWNHIAITVDSTSAKIYINNGTAETQTGTPTSFSNSEPTSIGGDGTTDTDYFTGQIDQIRIFSSALAAGDVEDLYNEHFQTKFTDGSDTALKFTGGTGDITFADTAPVFTPGDNFNTVLYTGNNGTQSITGVGFQPDFTWIKARDNGSNNHALTDSVRGTGSGNGLSSNTTGAEGQYSAAYGYLSAFGTDGFTVQAGSTSPNFVNSSSANYVAWSWKAGGAARNNTDGSIASLVSANVNAGFSIVKYTGNSTIPSTVAHGLDSAPELIMVKVLNQSYPWNVFSASIGNTKYLKLNETSAEATQISRWNNTSPTSAVFTIGNDGDVNGNGLNYIAYAFHSVAGYSKMGSYVGNGSATGPIITTGFEPAWVMVKRTDNTSAWNIQDNKRNTTNPRTSVLQASSSDQEYTSSTYAINFNTNDFQIVNSDNGWNTSGGTYIYMAFATNPT